MSINATSLNSVLPRLHLTPSPFEKISGIVAEVSPKHWLSGDMIQGSLNKYSQEDLERIVDDFFDLQDAHFANPKSERSYVVTAGAPGSGKTTYLEKLLASGSYRGFVYIDPDRTCLLKMTRTYLADVESGQKSSKEAYEYWRDASNFAANALLAIALQREYAIVHGSTSTSPHIKKVLDTVHSVYHYTTKMHHINCDEAVRIDSYNQRNAQGAYQCTIEDFRDKVGMFYQRLPDYLHTAHIDFIYRDERAVKKVAEKREFCLRILDKNLCQKIQNAHDAAFSKGYWAQSFEGADTPQVYQQACGV